MPLEAFLDSKYQLALHSMQSAQVIGDKIQSSNSDNVSISGSCITSALPILEQGFHLSQHTEVCRSICQQGSSGTKSLSKLQESWNSLDAEKQELYTMNQMHKKRSLDISQDAVLNLQIVQQLLQSQNFGQLQGHSQLPQTFIQQHNKDNQKRQKLLQLVPELQGIDLEKQREQEVKDYFQQLALQQVQHMHPFNSNICSSRLRQYMYHLQQRPPENDIAYWKKFVVEYYAPCAKKRWCFSLCDSVPLHAISIFRQAAMDTWKCELCSTKCGRGFEANFEALPRLNKILFESVINELLFLELPHESRLPSGLMTLECGRAVLKSVFDQLHVVREGKLRIIFTLDLKILSWEFCLRDHEELWPLSVITSQVNEIVHAAKEYQTTVNGNGSAQMPSQVLAEKHNLLLSAGSKLQKTLDLQLIGELGFSKRYIRCLQIADFFNSMKDLMTFSLENKIGPIESLENYTRKMITKFQRDAFEEKAKLEAPQGTTNDKTKLSSVSCALNGNANVYSNTNRHGVFTSSKKVALMQLRDYCRLLGQRTTNSNVSKLEQPSYVYELADSQNSSLSSSLVSESNQNIQERMIQKLPLQMADNRRAANWLGNKVVDHMMDGVNAGLPMPTDAIARGAFENWATFENSTSVEANSINTSSGIKTKELRH